MKTKKFPISITYANFKAKSDEFLIPFIEKGKKGFRGLKSGQTVEYGLIAYIGKEINEKDVFAKLVDSGQRINDVDATLKMISRYIENVQMFKIGNIISIKYSDDGLDFQLIIEANSPPKSKGKLP